MTLQEVRKLASQGEGQRVEFKKKAAHPDKIIREVIAFANSDGGHLIIGVDDDGRVSGQRFIEEEVYVMDQAIKTLVKPTLEVDKSIFALSPKKGVAVYTIHRSPRKPHFIWEEKRKKAFVRVGDRSIQASREVWEILRRSKNPKDIIFQYGEKETILMKALEANSSITLKEFAKLAGLSKFIASKTLIRLVLANVLEILPKEGEDVFRVKA
ncbi:AlbA family DNA-binding domain-containing protein [Pararhodonellum marinum]|uniref:AlbA family DNA-binding domain-containing protein n=1 Tax=Pararhodonellum marinum TaxID=2755358 RepID=UPI00188F068F|nr:ATP-binding protein [Pararhodonellum marinum]